MAKRKSWEDAACPVARSLDAIGDWWSLLIVRDAFLGRRRFCELQRSLGTARNILAARLRKLVAQGVLEAVPASDGGAYQEYLLTEKGRGLYLVLVALRQWGERHLCGPGTTGTRLVDREKGEPVRPLELKSQDGRVLGPGDICLLGERDGDSVEPV
jgi:DNA-binding HxlR family transcriptional regulator